MVNYIETLFNLDGKVAAITGGGGYLCSEMARGLARSGCKVAIMDIREEKALKVAKEIQNDFKKDAISIELDATKKVSFISFAK